MSLKHFVLFGAVPGVVLFLLKLFEYFLSGTSIQHVITENVELPCVVIVLGISLYVAVVARRKRGLQHHFGYGVAMSASAGVIWALLMFLYVSTVNLDYPKIISQRAIPIGARGAETTVLPGTIEVMENPVVQLFWRPVMCCLWGMVFIGILSAWHAIRRARAVAT
jgi:hypothetical protein